MSYIDIAIIVLIALLALVGLWKGVFKTLVGFCGGLIAMVLAVLLTKVVAYALLDVDSIAKFVCGTLYGKILSFLPAKGSESGILSMIVTPIYAKIASYAGFESLPAETSRQAGALMLSYGIFSVIVCIGLFIVFRILMILFTMFLNSLSKGGKPGGVSRLFGFLVGAIRGFAYSVIALMILGYLVAIPQLAGVGAQIENSVIAKPVTQTVRSMTERLFTGKDSATIEKLASITGVDLTGENVPDNGDEELPPEDNGGGNENENVDDDDIDNGGENLGGGGEDNGGGNENENVDGGEDNGGEDNGGGGEDNGGENLGGGGDGE